MKRIKVFRGTALLLILLLTGLTEARTIVYIGPSSGCWGWSGFNISFSEKVDGRIFLNAFLPFWWDYDHIYNYPYGYYCPYCRAYGKIIVNPKEDYSLKNQDVTGKDQDTIFYGGIQIHPAGRIKITTHPEVADIEIDGLPVGKSGIDKPFEMGLFVGKHKVILKKDGNEVFSTEVDIERNKEVSLKINFDGIDKNMEKK